MTPELRWLLALLTGPDQPPPPNCDRQRVRALLVHHRLTGSLAGRAAVLLDQPDLATLQRNRAIRELQAVAGLRRVAAVFEAAGLPLLALKGPCYAAQFYADPSQRTGCDIDLLIRPQDMAAALSLLAGLGYHPAERREEKSLDLDGPPGWPRLDLHTALTGVESILPAAILDPFGTAISLRFAGQTVQTLCPAAAIVYAAHHAARHSVGRLHWLEDFRQALLHPATDWQAVLTLAARLGVERVIFLMARLCQRLLATPLPPLLTRQDPVLDRMAGAIIGQFALPPSERGLRLYAPLRHLRHQVHLHTSWRARFDLLRFFLAPSAEDRQAAALPRGLGFLYPLLKFRRILRRRAAGQGGPR